MAEPALDTRDLLMGEADFLTSAAHSGCANAGRPQSLDQTDGDHQLPSAHGSTSGFGVPNNMSSSEPFPSQEIPNAEAASHSPTSSV